MDLIQLVIYLVVLGLVLYVISILPIDGTIKRIIHVVVIIAVVLWLLQVVIGGGHTLHIGR